MYTPNEEGGNTFRTHVLLVGGLRSQPRLQERPVVQDVGWHRSIFLCDVTHSYDHVDSLCGSTGRLIGSLCGQLEGPIGSLCGQWEGYISSLFGHLLIGSLCGLMGLAPWTNGIGSLCGLDWTVGRHLLCTDRVTRHYHSSFAACLIDL